MQIQYLSRSARHDTSKSCRRSARIAHRGNRTQHDIVLRSRRVVIAAESQRLRAGYSQIGNRRSCCENDSAARRSGGRTHRDILDLADRRHPCIRDRDIARQLHPRRDVRAVPDPHISVHQARERPTTRSTDDIPMRAVANGDRAGAIT